MTSNSVDGFVLHPSAFSGEDNYNPLRHAFDKMGSAFKPGINALETSGHGFTIQLPIAEPVYAYRINVDHISHPAVRKWVLEGSNDNANWDLLHRVESRQEFLYDEKWYTYYPDKMDTYFYYRFTTLENDPNMQSSGFRTNSSHL